VAKSTAPFGLLRYQPATFAGCDLRARRAGFGGASLEKDVQGADRAGLDRRSRIAQAQWGIRHFLR
jgi:hypothetical protein